MCFNISASRRCSQDPGFKQKKKKKKKKKNETSIYNLRYLLGESIALKQILNMLTYCVTDIS